MCIRDSRMLEICIVPMLGHFKLKDIKPIHIQRFVNALEERTTHLDGKDVYKRQDLSSHNFCNASIFNSGKLVTSSVYGVFDLCIYSQLIRNHSFQLYCSISR